jgi:hypothetical protein
VDRGDFAKYTGSEIKINGEKYLIMPESDILAVWTSSPQARQRGISNGKRTVF